MSALHGHRDVIELSVLYIARVGLELVLDSAVIADHVTFSPLHSEGGIGTDLYALFSTSNSESLH